MSGVTAASRERVCPPTVVNPPPMKILAPSLEAANAYTIPFVDGFQSGSKVPSARMAATLLRATPDTDVNDPPM